MRSASREEIVLYGKMRTVAQQLLREHNRRMFSGGQRRYKMEHHLVYIQMLDCKDESCARVAGTAVVALRMDTHRSHEAVRRTLKLWANVYAPERACRYSVPHTARIAVERMFTFDQFLVVYSDKLEPAPEPLPASLPAIVVATCVP